MGWKKTNTQDGGVISIFIILMAVYMIVQNTKRLKEHRIAEDISNG